jgi:hypothetical protein
LDSRDFPGRDAKRGNKVMTWNKIKRAVEKAGVKEEDEILLIHCENREGDNTFHKMKLGKGLVLSENVTVDQTETTGCAV